MSDSVSVPRSNYTKKIFSSFNPTMVLSGWWYHLTYVDGLPLDSGIVARINAIPGISTVGFTKVGTTICTLEVIVDARVDLSDWPKIRDDVETLLEAELKLCGKQLVEFEMWSSITAVFDANKLD